MAETSQSEHHHNGLFFLQPILTSGAVPPPNLNEAFVEELKSTGISMSHDAEDRVFRGHGKLWDEKPLPLFLFSKYCLFFLISPISCVFSQAIAYMRSLLCGKEKLVAFQTWWCGQVSALAVSSPYFYWSVFLLPHSINDPPGLGDLKG